jgi:UDP-glucose 4-epimerase
VKILVTGGAGFIASHVVDAYIADGHEVAIVDDLSTGHRENLHPRARFYEMDIRDPALADVFAAERPEVVNHHGAQMSVRVSVDEPLRDASINVIGSLNLFECARQAGVRKVIYISTGGAAYGEPRYLPCDEGHPVDPLCPYGISKHTPEHYLALYERLYHLDYTVLRYPNVYGPRQDPHGEAGVVAIFAGKMLRGEPVVINGTGEQERDFVAIGDIAAANLAALWHGDGEIINLGSGRGTSVNEIFAALAAITGYDQSPLFGPEKSGEVFKIYLTGDKARLLLHWQPTVSLAEGLARTVASLHAAVPERVAEPIQR